MFKKIICAILIALMLTCLLVSCSNEPETPNDNGENGGNEGGDGTTPPPADKPKELAFILKDDGTYKVEIGTAGELSKIEIPSTYNGAAVTSIGCFGSTDANTDPNTVLKEIVIPDSITAIGDDAFKNCKALTNITLPDSVLTLGKNAFSGCNALVSIDLGNSLVSIDEGAFQSCSALSEITIPDSVLTIGKNAFYSCTHMKSITIGTGLTSIGESVFTNCTGLRAVYVTDLDKWCRIAFANNSSNPIFYSHNIYVNGEMVSNLVIPETVTEISPRAFLNCNSLFNVTLHSGVTAINENAFHGCIKIIEVINHSSLNIALGSESNGKIGAYARDVHSGETKISYVDDYLFYNIGGEIHLIGYGKDNVDLVLPESFNGKDYVISANAFYEMKHLNSVVIPDCVTAINESAFYLCNNMTAVTIGSGVKTIAESAFNYCNKLESVTIPDSVTSIGARAFNACINMTYLKIGNGVKTIGEGAFTNCSKLTGVYVDSLENWLKLTFASYNSNPLSGAQKLFINGELLTDLVIPESITAINDFAFYYCAALSSITLHDNVTSIGNQAFAFCDNITGIKLGENLESIGENAFSYCCKLSEIINLSQVEITAGSEDNGSIGLYAIEVHNGESKIDIIDNYIFYSYDKGNLLLNYIGKDTELVLPESYNGEGYVINSYAFFNNPNYLSITISGGVTSIGKNAFEANSNLATLIFQNGVTTIEECAFQGCGALTQIILPQSLTTIGRYAFRGCGDLARIDIPDGLLSIGTDAFNFCADIERVNITNIEKWCSVYFENDKANPINGSKKLYVNGELVTNLVIPEGVTVINSYAFYYCSSLTSITLPNSLTDIGLNAFNYCYKLVEVINHSALELTKGSRDYGNVALYAKEIHTGASKVVDVNDYLFYTYNGVNYLLYYKGESTELVLPESYNGEVYKIHNGAFYNRHEITSIEVPDSVTNIGARAFYNCSGITSICAGSMCRWTMRTTRRGAVRAGSPERARRTRKRRPTPSRSTLTSIWSTLFAHRLS